MPAPYSEDLRLKALAAVDRGDRKSHVCRTFGIGRSTLDDWLKRRQTSGTVAHTPHYRRGPQPKIADLEYFRDFAATHGHLTQEQMAQRWSQPISNRTIGKALKKIGFTRKKRPKAIENVTKPSKEPS
ncbi:transposase [Rubidibacter lacunae KORDI 51-2]|uniref:Transposase n=1 Tax=Rubidibacter lacunae KORDI 51-2 TaxID=582515 RepID=U5DCU2_9CHRO|nr:IS630 transposase-related protein [Rubidibacter lacunae]ERN42348.1 transposase [Rubidibacter lacunae KORDI 51-2]